MFLCANYCHLFFFNDTATTEIYTLSLHDALPISIKALCRSVSGAIMPIPGGACTALSQSTCCNFLRARRTGFSHRRSEEHTSELQSRQYLVCRLLLEKKNMSMFARTSPTLPAPHT